MSTAQRYFRLHGPPGDSAAWFLGPARGPTGQEFDLQGLAYGRRTQLPETLVFVVRSAGIVLDWSFADFGVPVVRPNVLDLLTQFAASDFEWTPARVDGATERFAVVNITSSLDGLDEQRSVLVPWPSGTPELLTRKRKFMGVTRITVNPARVSGHNLFRLANWSSAIIVSEQLRDALSECDGAFFEPVTSD